MTYFICDADSIAYQACCCSKDKDEEGFERDLDVVIDKINTAVSWMLDELQESMGVDCYKLVVGTPYNFRKIIYPQYKANRTSPKPALLGDALGYMVKELNAFSSPYLEADDLVLGIKRKLEESLENNVVVGFLDKDLLQDEGTYFDYYYNRKERLVTVSQKQAVQNFWCSMLTGDKADNILTKKGIGIKTAQKILGDADNHFTALRKVYPKYLEWFGRKGRERFMLNYRLLRMVTHKVPTPETFEMVI